MPTGTGQTIYLLAPARTRTGGPEALHQLGRALLELGHDARMVYRLPQAGPEVTNGVLTFPDQPDAMPPDYAVYGVPRDTVINDLPGNAVVIPEIWPEAIPLLKQATRYLWWQSIDNGLAAVEAFGGLAAIQRFPVIHLCQSYYSLAWLADRGVLGLPLFDYISASYHDLAVLPPLPRADRVLYSPKGRWLSQQIRRWAPDLQWQELQGFATEAVQNLFRTSKLFIDFGSHPGKDRMPREAVTLGCCLITGRRGSAANPFDIPILARYKFRDSRLMIPRIVRAIRTALSEYEQSREDFATYRRIIAGEREEFRSQVARIFGGARRED